MLGEGNGTRRVLRREGGSDVGWDRGVWEGKIDAGAEAVAAAHEAASEVRCRVFAETGGGGGLDAEEHASPRRMLLMRGTGSVVPQGESGRKRPVVGSVRSQMKQENGDPRSTAVCFYPLPAGIQVFRTAGLYIRRWQAGPEEKRHVCQKSAEECSEREERFATLLAGRAQRLVKTKKLILILRRASCSVDVVRKINPHQMEEALFDMETFLLRQGIARAVDVRRRETAQTVSAEDAAQQVEDAAAAAAAYTATEAATRAEVTGGDIRFAVHIVGVHYTGR